MEEKKQTPALEAEKKPAKKEAKKPDLERQIKECEKLRDEYLTGWKRARADYLNYKREDSQRTEELISFAKSGWALKLLTLFDNLARAEAHLPADLKESEWVKGVLQIQDQFNDFLKEEGIEEIQTEGKTFDPCFHEAIEQIEVEGKESGVIVEVLEKGYKLNGRVLRPAKVRVTK